MSILASSVETESLNDEVRCSVFWAVPGVKEERRRLRRVVLDACNRVSPFPGTGAAVHPCFPGEGGVSLRLRGSASFERKTSRWMPTGFTGSQV